MNIEEGSHQITEDDDPSNNVKTSTQRKAINWPLLVLNCSLAAIGNVGGPLVIRLYYLHGGNRRWLVTFTETAGFPFIIIPLTFLFLRSRAHGLNPSLFFLERKLFVFSAVFGIAIGLDNFMYSVGLSYIPASTSALLSSTQLAFVAFFAWIIVKQKFTAFSVNSVVLMTLGAVVLAFRSESDRPVGVTSGQYLLGFLMTLACSALIGLVWPCVELSYTKGTRPVNYAMVLQFQLNMSLFATIVSTVGMAINKDFQAIHREANEYGLGHRLYYVVIIGSIIVWQITFMGILGVVFCTSSLFSGIWLSILLPVSEILATLIFHESFTGEKGMSLALCLWGLTSYFYGEYRRNKDVRDATYQTEVEPQQCA